jgi:peptide/nickel transport system substrate-binding protein
MPSSPAPPDGPPYFGESEQFHRYAAYDPAKANQLLDELGLKWDAKKEYRMRPDGKPLQLTAIVMDTWGYHVEVSEMLKKYWEDVGVGITLKPLGSALHGQQMGALNYDLSIRPVNWGGRRPIITAMRGEPVPISENWGTNPQWARWLLSDGARGEEPPAPVKRLYQLHLDFMAEPDAAKREAMEKEIFKIHCDEFYMLTVIKQPSDLLQVYYNPIHNRMGNVYAPVAPEWYYCQPSTWYAKWHED